MNRRKFLYLSGLTLASCALPIPMRGNVNAIPVLGYHDIRYSGHDMYSIPPGLFNTQMKWLYDNGWRTIPLNSTSYKEKEFCITFDDGYKSYVETAVPIMREYRFSSEISVIGEYVGKDMPDTNENRPMMSWDDYSNLLDGGGIEIGSHTHSLHHYSHRGVEGVSNEALLLDLLKSKRELKDNLGVVPTALTWPYGMYLLESMRMAQAVGFTHIITSNAGRMTQDNLIDIPRICLTGRTKMEEFIDDISNP